MDVPAADRWREYHPTADEVDEAYALHEQLSVCPPFPIYEYCAGLWRIPVGTFTALARLLDAGPHNAFVCVLDPMGTRNFLNQRERRELRRMVLRTDLPALAEPTAAG